MADEPYVNPFRKVHQKSAARRQGPHLIEYQGATRCSVCKMPFLPDTMPSVDEAFADHIRNAHRPGQTSEDVNQAAARIVRETASN